EDDPLNPKVADEYGIVMGTSHHEPMMRAQKEWGNHRKEYGNGEWNYHTNKNALLKFWEDGFNRNKNYDNLVTMGMRGDGDEPMTNLGSA
ncbi:glycosyl hydrolase 115 family protein, partial [Klebsiella pneumoniae]